jgi:hypothetical protein
MPATPFNKTVLSMDYTVSFQHTERRPSAARQRESAGTSHGVLRRGERNDGFAIGMDGPGYYAVSAM